MCKNHLLSQETIDSMQSRPEITIGDILERWKDLPLNTVVRIDAGSCFTEYMRPEQAGLLPVKNSFRTAGNNVRIFGVSAPGEGVVWLEL